MSNSSDSSNSTLQCVPNYLCTKGVAIKKSDISVEEQTTIRNLLMVKPFAPMELQKKEPFPIYRESNMKLYVPRYFALQQFGPPTSSTLEKPDSIQVEFKGDLRDYQKNIVKTYIKETKNPDTGSGLLEIPCGRGKCFAKDTKIRMYESNLSKVTFKYVQDIENGDIVMGDDFTPRLVYGKNTGFSDMYTIYQTHGKSYTVNIEHILTLYHTKTCTIIDIPLYEFLLLSPRVQEEYRGVRIFRNMYQPIFSMLRIKKERKDNYYGFVISGNHRFLLSDNTIVHNTVMALNIICQLQYKTLVIVHKEFLMNQWIERIEQFIPDAKIGKIQGKVVDVKNKDIVVGMLQSLSMKEYDRSLFSPFGLTIVDECHHISAEVFCRSLFKIVTKHMLGLSATMNRKDGLTRVFKMFLGDVVYKEKRKGDDNVTIRAIHYSNNDEEYAEMIYNFRGQAHYSAMIKKICEWSHRTEFVIRVLKDTLEELPQQQIMILSHNKSMLSYLYSAIEFRQIGTVGYYVGGMKETALKESESKQIILATYAMAEEALDIKTLACLIMATPKTDVTQAVGRILRIKHDMPLVIDIVDQHEVFVRQFKKRKTFYKKCKYSIYECNSDTYDGDWESIMKKDNTLFKPKSDKTIMKKVCLI